MRVALEPPGWVVAPMRGIAYDLLTGEIQFRIEAPGEGVCSCRRQILPIPPSVRWMGA